MNIGENQIGVYFMTWNTCVLTSFSDFLSVYSSKIIQLIVLSFSEFIIVFY